MHWLCVDPGETTGYSLWNGGELVLADQAPMWNFIDMVDMTLRGPSSEAVARPGCGHVGLFTPEGEPVELGALVVEDWQLYPWVIRAGGLDYDKCRTARAIGALTLLCRQHGAELIFQGADIKKGAQAAGAEALYLEPVYENRHANDSIQHGVFYLAVNGGPPC
jgi:hypothetical protein